MITKKVMTRLLYNTILKATEGNTKNMNEVMQHYSRYISTLCLRQIKDVNGYIVMCVDEEMRCQLETKLMNKVLGFQIF